MRTFWILCMVGVVAVTGACAREVSARPPEMSLNGPWEYVKVPELTVPPPSSGWQPISVPQCLFGWNYERAWFRRRFQIPAEWAGMRLKLRFKGAKWNSQVYVNAFEVGGHFGGYEPFTLDITAAARPGATNELLVGLHDWTGVFHGTPNLGPEGGPDELRSRPKDAVLAPIGGHITAYGLWDDVTLQAVPPVHIDDVWVQTSVRRGEITVRVTLANESQESVQAIVSNTVRSWEGEEGGRQLRRARGRSVKPALVLPQQTVTLPPGARQSLTCSQAWPQAETWSPNNPKLYELQTQLELREWRMEEGKSKSNLHSPISNLHSPLHGDSVSTRFGFREFWIEGPDFFLNGAKIHLLAASTWPSVQPQSRQEVEQTLRQIKAAHCVCFRTHTQPWREVWYEVADEVGLLMIPEGAVWNDDEVYRIDDPAFWDNYADHLQRTVDHLKNHPSVIAYSLENELYGARLNDASPAKAALVELGRKMKEWDPTRPITYESDLDPDGVADFIGLHYPHEYPDFNLYPNTCYWLDEPLRAPGGFTNGAGEWIWKRDKPLYIGEFLWVPSNDPSWHTIFFGDEAYTDYQRYRNLAKAWAWRMQIEAYRWYGVSGICPWTMFEGGPRLDEENPLFVACREAFAPIAAVVREYDTRFYANQEVARTVTVYNDILSPSVLTLAWTLEGGGKTQAADQVKVVLQPAERKTISVALRTPEVAEPTPWTWRIRVLREGRVQQEQVKNYTVFPALGPWRLPTARIGLYDPNGRTRKVLARQGVAFEEVAGLEDLFPPEGGEKAPYDLVIIGERALRAGPRPRPVIGSVDPLAERLEGFVRNGGRVLVLAQEAYPAHLFPADLSNHAATLAFAQQPDHPLLRGIQGEDLRFWRGDHLVSENNPVRPRTEGCRPIVTAGSAQGLDYAPVLEFPRGQGTLLLCQLKLVEKFAVEPIAARLLENALRYLITCRPAAKPVAVAGDAAFQQILRGYHLRFEDVTATLPEVDLSRYSLLLVHADVQPLLRAAGRIRDFVERGGKVYLHALTPPAWNSLQPLVGASHLFLQPHRGPVVKDPQAPLARRLLHEDLYWLGERVGFPWSGAETPRSLRVAPFAFSKTLDPATAQVFEAEGMEVQALISGPTEGGVVLATVGTLRQKIDFPEAGAYVFGFRAGGSSVAGIFPLVEVRLDGRLVGTVSLTRGEYDLYTVWGTVSAGSHTLSLSFTNDAQVGGEDRNLWVDKLYVARDTAPESRNVTFLTQPPAVAQIRQGRGFYLVDEVSWDTEEINAHKAARYVTTLLTELGADFYRTGGALIEAEEMQPDSDIAWFRREGGAVSLGSRGTLRTAVECARAGQYIFEIVGYSTPAEGQYGIVALAIDGRPVGEVELKAASWRGFPLEVTLAPGVHEIALTFTNDLYKPPEDRNVWLDRVEVYPAEWEP